MNIRCELDVPAQNSIRVLASHEAEGGSRLDEGGDRASRPQAHREAREEKAHVGRLKDRTALSS